LAIDKRKTRVQAKQGLMLKVGTCQTLGWCLVGAWLVLGGLLVGSWWACMGCVGCGRPIDDLWAIAHGPFASASYLAECVCCGVQGAMSPTSHKAIDTLVQVGYMVGGHMVGAPPLAIDRGRLPPTKSFEIKLHHLCKHHLVAPDLPPSQRLILVFCLQGTLYRCPSC
jgi:hypothetical protein